MEMVVPPLATFKITQFVPLPTTKATALFVRPSTMQGPITWFVCLALVTIA